MSNRLLTTMFLCLTCIAVSCVVFAETTRSTVPASLAKSCILTDDGYIDTCPTYRTKVKGLNEMFYKTWSSQEKSAPSAKDMFLALSKFSIQLQTTKKQMYVTRQMTSDNIFMIDYLSYLTNLYKKEIGQRSVIPGSLDVLFAKTYYNTSQSGLVFAGVGLFDPTISPKVYDEQLMIQVSLRNFEQESITSIEDVYCFATVGQKDYIFPLGLGQTPIGPNTVQKTVGVLNLKDSDITATPGPQDMYCMLVYTDAKKNEITTPFATFSFVVE